MRKMLLTKAENTPLSLPASSSTQSEKGGQGDDGAGSTKHIALSLDPTANAESDEEDEDEEAIHCFDPNIDIHSSM